MADLKEIAARIPGVRENVPLKDFTTFKIGGPARWYCIAENEADLVAALDAATALELPAFVLGGGSNLLISDRGFDGLVIHNRNRGVTVDGTKVTVGSGTLIAGLLRTCARQGLGGMEFMAGIPGTVGGAITGNAGAWGHGFGELCRTVRCHRDGKIEELAAEALAFAYRSSALRTRGGTVLSAVIELVHRETSAIDAEAKEIVTTRLTHVPTEPSAGSVFKNIELASTPIDVPRLLKALDATAEEYQHHTRYGKLPIGFLLERIGMLGMRIGGAAVSKKHANVIVNPEGRATADDVMQLIAVAKTRARNHLGIPLHEEVQCVGF